MPAAPKIIETYSRVTLVLAPLTTGGEPERVPVLIGNADRIKAKRVMDKPVEAATEDGDGEEWMAHAAHFAWRRETGSTQEFEPWLERFIGSEFEDEEADDAGKAPRAE